MNGRWFLLLVIMIWVGFTLILSELRWFSRRPLDDRLAPYLGQSSQRSRRSGVLSVESFRDVFVPLATSVGDFVSRGFGLHDDLPSRLQRIHSTLDPVAFRVRQLTFAVMALLAGAALTLMVDLPVTIGILVILGSPLLAFLILEQEVAGQSTRWQRRVFLELPVVCEQIGMLLSAGFSMSSALDRIATRGNGCCARDLGRVCQRIRQGLSESEALREWANLVEVDAVHRLVGVLALNRETGDLGRLISEEARAVRREVQRQNAATIDKRSQQVWIPVTVATLVPGTIFLAVPFLQAMELFGV